MLTATLYYNAITRDYSKTLAATAAEPSVSQQTKYFLANIGNAKTANDLINNSKLHTYVMKAFGLSDMMEAKGLIRQVLEGGVANPKSLANTFNDPRYKALATAFNFSANGANTTSSMAVQQTTVSNYIEQTLGTNVGQQNQGTQEALYFQRMAPNITSAYSILADKTLLSVAQTALGLPTSMSEEPIDTQAKMITSQLNIADLKNPAKLQKFIERFTATYDSTNTSAPPTTPLTPLFDTSNTVGLGKPGRDQFRPHKARVCIPRDDRDGLWLPSLWRNGRGVLARTELFWSNRGKLGHAYVFSRARKCAALDPAQVTQLEDLLKFVFDNVCGPAAPSQKAN